LQPIKDGTGFREYYRRQYEDRFGHSTHRALTSVEGVTNGSSPLQRKQ
jgi:hypothetical protein